jgi:hypothetical protein
MMLKANVIRACRPSRRVQTSSDMSIRILFLVRHTLPLCRSNKRQFPNLTTVPGHSVTIGEAQRAGKGAPYLCIRALSSDANFSGQYQNNAI